jgi:hypothetical protein
MLTGALQLPLLRTTTSPESSTAPQKRADAQDIETKLDWLSVATVRQFPAAVDSRMLPLLSTAKHLAAVAQEMEAIVALSFW